MNELTEDQKDLILQCINCAINNSCSDDETNELFELFHHVNEFGTRELSGQVDGGEGFNPK